MASILYHLRDVNSLKQSASKWYHDGVVMQHLLLATGNPGKVTEYKMLLGDISLTLVTPLQQGITDEPEETGTTFEENALLKARYYTGVSGLPALADDSGLEVDELGGRPGVYSARYGGPGASDADRARFLLDAIEGVPWERRTARFRCVVALVWPGGEEVTFHGTREGYIALESKGANGFGYDPVFFLPELAKTFAELAPEVKNRWSHRAEAARKAAERLAERYTTDITRSP
jgi:XTP/dITP diphosphohydrolase